MVFHWKCLFNQYLLTVPKHCWVMRLQRKDCSSEKHLPTSLEISCLILSLLKSLCGSKGHPHHQVPQKGWLAPLTWSNGWWSNCTVGYHWCQRGEPVVSHSLLLQVCWFHKRLCSRSMQTPLQMTGWFFPAFLTQGNYFYPPLQLTANESYSSNLKIQVEH